MKCVLGLLLLVVGTASILLCVMFRISIIGVAGLILLIAGMLVYVSGRRNRRMEHERQTPEES